MSVTNWLERAREAITNAQAAVAAAEQAPHDDPLLFKVSDLKQALRDLHFGEGNVIAERVCKSLVPYSSAYTEAELLQANVEMSPGSNGSLIRRIVEQARKNRIVRSVKEG